MTPDTELIGVAVRDGYLSVTLPPYESAPRMEAQIAAIYDAVQKHKAQRLSSTVGRPDGWSRSSTSTSCVSTWRARLGRRVPELPRSSRRKPRIPTASVRMSCGTAASISSGFWGMRSRRWTGSWRAGRRRPLNAGEATRHSCADDSTCESHCRVSRICMIMSRSTGLTRWNANPAFSLRRRSRSCP
jgi:hypothetical protein